MNELLILIPFVAAGVLAVPGMRPTYRKVGGLHFWRIGRLGGSVYIARH